ncbi:unnamed protein product [Candida verbasci]|uniref:BAR domain-containing protein n=1 Tax=Candida verbasci TaxID=1227364 RepID=A0A9W4TVL7_9ASCO|nr:unnamed protein product [Candida verbasci]
MSWSQIIKTIDQTKNKLMVQFGQLDQTTDTKFDYEEKRFKYLENHSLKLQKLFKEYQNCINIVKNTEININHDIQSFYGPLIENKEQERKNFSQLYFKTMKSINESNDFTTSYNHCILNPCSRFNSYFKDINSYIKKRNDKLLEYDSMKNKVKKLCENPSSSTTIIISSSNSNPIENLNKMNQELTNIENDFMLLNDDLKNELPKFINLRIPFLNPTFESFVKLQLKYFNDNYKELSKLQNTIDANTKMLYEQDKLDDKLDNILKRMRNLDIAGVQT